MNYLGEIIIPAIVFGAIVYVIKYWLDYRIKSKLIEKGAEMPKIEMDKVQSDWQLKIGLLLIGLAVGFLMGEVLSQYSQLHEGPAFMSMILMGGGLGLISYNFIEYFRKK